VKVAVIIKCAEKNS